MELTRPAIEHRTSLTGRWLRAHRLEFALGIAVVEGVLVVAGVIPTWAALLVAAGVTLLYLAAVRTLRSQTLRQAGWIAAGSQVLVALVPALLLVVGVLAVLAVGVLGAIALVALFADRR